MQLIITILYKRQVKSLIWGVQHYEAYNGFPQQMAMGEILTKTAYFSKTHSKFFFFIKQLKVWNLMKVL